MSINFNTIINTGLGALAALIIFEMVISNMLPDSFEDDGY